MAELRRQLRFGPGQQQRHDALRLRLRGNGLVLGHSLRLRLLQGAVCEQRHIGRLRDQLERLEPQVLGQAALLRLLLRLRCRAGGQQLQQQVPRILAAGELEQLFRGGFRSGNQWSTVRNGIANLHVVLAREDAEAAACECEDPAGCDEVTPDSVASRNKLR